MFGGGICDSWIQQIYQKVMKICSTHKGAFIINDFLRNPNFEIKICSKPLGSYKKSSVHSQKPEWEEQNEQQEKDDQNKQQEKEKQTTKDRARQRWKILCLVKTSGHSIYMLGQ